MRVYKISDADEFARGAARPRVKRRPSYYDEEFTE